MADNFIANAGAGGDTFAADDVAGIKFPRTKLSLGADGAFDGDISASNPMPVTGPLTDAQLRAVAVPVSGTFWQATQPVSGTLTANIGTIAGLATEATVAAMNGKMAALGQGVMAGSMPVVIASNQSAIPVSGPLTDTQLRATPVPVSGTVAVNVISGFATEATLAARVPVNGQALMAASIPVAIASNQSALPVTGTFFQGTQPVSGPLTDAQLRAVAVPVSGTFFQATQPVSIAATVAVSGPLTDTQLRAAIVPVTLNDLTASGNITTQNLVPAGVATAGSAVEITLNGQNTLGVQVTGTYTGALNLQATIDGTTWVTTSSNIIMPSNGAIQSSIASAQVGAFQVNVAGYQKVRISGLAAMTGTAVVTLRASLGVVVLQAGASNVAMGTVAINAALPTGGNTIGSVNAIHPTLTKGTQGATGVSTQHLRDAGRNSRAFMLDAYVAAPVAEALQSVVQWFNNAAVAGTTQPAVVTAGKTLRLTSWAIQTKSLAAAGSAVMRIRANTGGLVVIGSPLVWSAEVGSKAAVAGLLDGITGVFPEGFEFPAGTGLGFTLAGYNATGVLTLMGVTRFQVFGYEY